MAETEAMEPTPKMAGDESYHGMSMSDAMDMVEQHGLTAENYKDVITAAEMVYGEEDTDPGQMKAGGEDQAMLDQAYASGRGR